MRYHFRRCGSPADDYYVSIRNVVGRDLTNCLFLFDLQKCPPQHRWLRESSGSSAGSGSSAAVRPLDESLLIEPRQVSPYGCLTYSELFAKLRNSGAIVLLDKRDQPLPSLYV